MAADPRQQRLLLMGLLGVLAIVAWWQVDPFGSPAPVRTAAVRQAPPPRGAPARSADEILSSGVGLERLTEIPPAPDDAGRDPFVLGQRRRFEAEAGGALRGGGDPLPPAVMPPMEVGPVGPPPPAPIAVKFIGVVRRADVGQVAVLSDGRNVYYGREGEIVDGRWRIVRIGEESLQIEYVDGRGRQTVRLSG